jgi:hypothetical protein
MYIIYTVYVCNSHQSVLLNLLKTKRICFI